MGGGHSTYVANAYSEDIEAKVDDLKENQTCRQCAKDVEVKIPHLGLKEDASENDVYIVERKEGYTTIKPGDYLLFDVSGSNGRVYVSIKSGRKKIANGYPLRNDHSVIVDADGYVQRTEFKKIWVDEKGTTHFAR